MLKLPNRIHVLQSVLRLMATAVVAALLLCAGCTKAPAMPVQEQSQKPKAVRTFQGVLLPEWAPEHPSPEFMRAARVLRPMPEEALVKSAKEGQYNEALLIRYRKTWPVTYELFGTLTEEQMRQFRATKKVRFPVKAMTKRQRATLDRWFEVWRESMAGCGDKAMEDLLVTLYKAGAKEDLSNVEFGFDVPAKAPVHLRLRLKGPMGESEGIGLTFAMFGGGEDAR